MRILVGLMLVYTHLVWTLELETFFSDGGVFNREYSKVFMRDSQFVWSHFFWSDALVWRWGTHILSLLVLVAFTLGFLTRWTSILSFLIVVSYANRAMGALFGLDQINAFLALYLAVGPSGAMYSLDSWIKRRRMRNHPSQPAALGDIAPQHQKSTMANIAIRLMNVHLCVVYLFAGFGKLLGESWWDGTALWGAFASYEYQTVDMTFLAGAPLLVNVMTMTALFWEASYAFLIWPKLTRPLYVLLSIPVHLGIGMCMGMMTFGLIMIIANLSFVPPRIVRHVIDPIFRNALTGSHVESAGASGDGSA